MALVIYEVCKDVRIYIKFLKTTVIRHAKGIIKTTRIGNTYIPLLQSYPKKIKNRDRKC